MTTTVSIQEAQQRLPELVDNLDPGEQIVITVNERPVAEIVSLPQPRPQPVFGSCKDMLTILSEDDEHLKDFEEYMP